MKASDLLVRALELEGVEYVFALPGEENLDILESLRQSKQIKLIVTRHEQGAGFMAAVYGRLTGKPGVCMATLGPGATNLVTPAAYASLGAFPMLMITGQKPIKSSKQGRFQIVDVVRLFEPITKLSRQIVHGNTIPANLREAFRLAEEERPGPVLLEIPEDIAEEETDSPLIEPHPRLYASAGSGILDKAAAMVREAKYPLVLVGAGANRSLVRESLTEFIETTGLPFFTTQMGKGVVDGRSDHYIGTAALSEGDYVHCAVDHADLIINIGHDVIEKPPFLMTPGGKKVIHVNFKAAQVDQVYFPQLEVIGCLSTSIRNLGKRLGRVDHDLSYFWRVRDEVNKHITDKQDDPRFPLLPQRIVGDVRKVMGERDIIALDNGMFKLWFARNYRAYHPNTILLDNALATMGAGLPSAMMAAMLYPDRRVMAICGDGGFMMNSQELETAVRLGLNLVVLVLKDGAFGMIRWKQDKMGFPDWGLEFGNPDFVQYACSYGAVGHRITRTEDFIPVIDQAFAAGGVHLIDVPVDYSENEKVLTEELAELVCQI